MIGICLSLSFLGGALLGPVAVLLVPAVCGVRYYVAPRRIPWLPAVAVVGASIFGVWRGQAGPTARAPEWITEAGGVVGRVVSVPAAVGVHRRFVVRISQIERQEVVVSADVAAAVTSPLYPVVQLGDSVRLDGSLSLAEDQSLGYRSYLRAHQYTAVIRADRVRVLAAGHGWRRRASVLRHELDARIMRAAPGDAGALMAGLVTGDDQALSRPLASAFLATGTTHLTAVSGSNLTLVVVVFSTIGSRAGWRKRLPWLTVMTCAVWAYAALTGFGPPVLRVALVATGALFASRFGRRPDHLTLLALAGALMVAVSPPMLKSLAFQLSCVSSLALVLVLSRIESTGRRGWLTAAVLAVTAAQVATLPILAASVGKVSLVALPANLLVMPLIAVAFPLAVVTGITGLLSASLSEIVSWPARLSVTGVFAVVERLAPLPGAVWYVEQPSPAGKALLVGVAAAVVAVLSRETRSRISEEVERVARLPSRLQWFWVGLVAGLVGGPALLVLAR